MVNRVSIYLASLSLSDCPNNAPIFTNEDVSFSSPSGTYFPFTRRSLFGISSDHHPIARLNRLRRTLLVLIVGGGGGGSTKIKSCRGG